MENNKTIGFLAIAYGTGAFVNQARAGLGPVGLQSPIANGEPQ